MNWDYTGMNWKEFKEALGGTGMEWNDTGMNWEESKKALG